MAPEIRRVTDVEADWPEIRELLSKSGGGAAARDARHLREILATEGSFALLAKDSASGLVGFVSAQRHRGAWIFEDDVASLRHFVAPNESVRTALLQAAEGIARQQGQTHLSVYEPANHEALPLYYGSGFESYMEVLRQAMPSVIDEDPDGGQAGVTIRPVSDLCACWPQLWTLLDALDRHHQSLTGLPLLSNREERAREYIETDWDDSLVLLGEVEGKAIACSFAQLEEARKDGTRTGYRSRLYVEPAYRGLGLTARFEAEALRWFRQYGVTQVERWVVAGNERPRDIWSAQGYSPVRALLRKAL